MSTPLFAHQKDAVEFAVARGGSCAIFHDTGTGKTRTAIEIYKKFLEKNPDLCLLVVAPISLHQAAWGEDIRTFAPEFSPVFRNLRKEKSKPSDKIFIVNYERLLSKPWIDYFRIVWRSRKAWMIVLDESSRAKNPNSKTAKMLLKMRPAFKHRIAMSGTPAPNVEWEYWAQMEFVAPNCLDRSFYYFRSKFFHLERNGARAQVPVGRLVTRGTMQKLFQNGWKYAITNEKREKLLAAISPHIHRALKEKCLDLPDQIDEIRKVEMTLKQSAAYKEMLRALYTMLADGTEIAARNALGKIMKLREITSGFAMDPNGRSAETDSKNPKLNELIDFLNETNGQVLIWGNFIWEIHKIVERLAEEFPESKCGTLYSGTDDRDVAINAFKNGETRFLVANPQSAAHGLTFVNCSTEVFFSIDYSIERYEQARARIHRAGQTKKCTYVHLFCENTIDEDIYAVLKRKGDMLSIADKMFQEAREAVCSVR